MTAESATLAGRRAAEGLMVDACTIVRPTGSGLGAYNPATMQYAAGTSTSKYVGKCRLRREQADDTHDQAAGKPVGVGPHLVTIPMSVTDVRLDDVVTITASALDAALVGLQLRVRSVVKGSHVTARRLVCDEVTQ